MSEPIRVVVHWDPQRTSPNQRKHWRAIAEGRKQARDAARVAWLCAGSPRAVGPVRVEITVRRGRMIDPDNALSGLKAVIDGLFKDAITPDDSAKWLAFTPVRIESHKRYRGAEEVEFLVTEATP